MTLHSKLLDGNLVFLKVNRAKAIRTFSFLERFQSHYQGGIGREEVGISFMIIWVIAFAVEILQYGVNGCHGRMLSAPGLEEGPFTSCDIYSSDRISAPPIRSPEKHIHLCYPLYAILLYALYPFGLVKSVWSS